MTLMAERLTDDERWWLSGLVNGWLAQDHNPIARDLALSVSRKISGVDKVVEIKTYKLDRKPTASVS